MFCNTISFMEHFQSLVCKCNIIYLVLSCILSVTDPIQGPAQGLYILPVSPTEFISPIIALQVEKTGKIICCKCNMNYFV